MRIVVRSKSKEYNKLSIKLQSSMEYLITYSMAIVIIASISALLYLSIFSGHSTTQLPSLCISIPGYTCSVVTLNASGYLSASVGYAGSTPIIVTGISCSYSNTQPNNITPVVPTEILPGQFANFVFKCSGVPNIFGSKFTGHLWLKYNNTNGASQLVSFATVSASVTTSNAIVTNNTVLDILPNMKMLTNIVKYIPIRITNTENIATPAPFQQLVDISSINYMQYEASNLQNVEFFYANGTIIPSWLESGNSNRSTRTIYWLKINNGIPASSSIIIYIGFANKTTNLFNAQTVGEAPQLSPVYAEYDNGANIFPYYQRWGGLSSLPSNWSIDNQVHVLFNPTNTVVEYYSNNASLLYKTVEVSVPAVLDFYGSLKSN
ncbi:MAG: hypothetical protein ACP5RP_02655 [Candidatus Micrarchaeia archaeon]